MKNNEWEEFKQTYLTNLDKLNRKTLKYLMQDDVINYIIENDTYDSLGKIANCRYKKLREKYFEKEKVNYMLECNKFGRNVWDRASLIPNGILLLKKDYILDALRCEDPIILICAIMNICGIEDIHNIDKYKKLDNNIYDTIIYILDYYMKNIENNKEYISGIISVLPLNIYGTIICYYKDKIIEYDNNNQQIDAKYDWIFENNNLYSLSTKSILNLLTTFKNNPRIYSTKKMVDIIMNKIRDRSNINILKKYIEYKRIKHIILKNNLNSNLYILRKAYGIEYIEEYLDDEALRLIDDNGNLDDLISNFYNTDYSWLYSKKIFAEIYDNNNTPNHGENLKNIEESTDVDIVFILLNNLLELHKYKTFYSLFILLNDKKQEMWLNSNGEKFKYAYDKNNCLIKSLKKYGYRKYNEFYKDEDYIYEYGYLKYILDNATEYDKNHLIRIFVNKENLNTIMSNCDTRIIIDILNLQIAEIDEFYLSDEIHKRIIDDNKVKDLFHKIRYTFNPPKNIGEIYKKDIYLEVIGDIINKEKEFNDYSYTRYSCEDFLESLSYKDISNDVVFKILDYCLKKLKYHKMFELVVLRLNDDQIEEYYRTRENIITRVVNENDAEVVHSILGCLKDENLKRELKPGRDIFNDEKFLAVSESTNRFISKELNFVKYIDDDKIRNELEERKNKSRLLKEELLKLLDDTFNDFESLLVIVHLSSYKDTLNPQSKVFLQDMHEMFYGYDYTKKVELYNKYKEVDLCKLKLKILKEIEDKSKENIINNLTSFKNIEIKCEDYVVKGKKYKIKVIYFDGEPFNFLIRTLDSTDYLFNGNFNEEYLGCYSTIYEDNQSTYYGDSVGRVICGYSYVDMDDIKYVCPVDAIVKRPEKQKYYPSGLKPPRWLSAQALNEQTKYAGTYNELRIKGRYLPDFLVAYDDLNDKTILYADSHDVPVVKIITRNYPNAKRNCDDIYSNWK